MYYKFVGVAFFSGCVSDVDKDNIENIGITLENDIENRKEPFTIDQFKFIPNSKGSSITVDIYDKNDNKVGFLLYIHNHEELYYD